MSRTILALALLLAGCASTSAPPDVVDATYRCEGDVVVPARFDNAAHVVDLTLPSGATARLAQQPSGSGIWYSAGGFDLRGKGREATISLWGGAPLKCYSLTGP